MGSLIAGGGETGRICSTTAEVEGGEKENIGSTMALTVSLSSSCETLRYSLLSILSDSAES